MKKKLPIGIVLIFLLSLFLAANVFAADSEGKCGDNLTYTISPDGSTLKIEGTGDMYDFEEKYDYPEPGVIVYFTSAPWGGIDDIGKLTTIEIGDGVTSIGACAFEACYNVTDIKIGSGLKTIRESAFAYCESLSKIIFPSSLETIEWYVLYECKSLSDVFYNGTKSQLDAINTDPEWDTNAPAFDFHVRCTVTFDANGHGTAPEPITDQWTLKTVDNDPGELTSDEIGFLFTGWYKDAGCDDKDKWDFANDLVEKDMTLYAGWKECEHKETEVIPGKDATCVEPGKTEGKKCTVCGKILTEQEDIPATGIHSWNEGEVTKEPTTSAEGEKTFTCTVCGTTKTEPIEKLTPAPTPSPDKTPTPAPVPAPGQGDLPKLKQQAKLLGEKDEPAGSTFHILQAKGKKIKKKAITIGWKSVLGASGYVIFGSKCGSKYNTLAEVKGTSFTQKKLKKGTYYKYYVAAYDKNEKVLAVSKTIHIATPGGKNGNTKAVKINKKKVSLKKGKSFKLKAKLKNGKLKVKRHRKIAFESSNPAVATVTKKGKIKAAGKGTCYVYAYAQNCVFAKCKVTVK